MARRRNEPLDRRPIRFPVYLDKRTYKQLRDKAWEKGISITEAVETLIKQWVKPTPKG